MSFQPGYLSYNQLREAAEDFLNQYHDERTIPVPIEEIVEFDLNISVVAIEGLRQQLGVDAFLTNDVGRIFMDQWVMMSAPERYRFSLAHEVAHYWIHSDLYEASTANARARCRRQEGRPPSGATARNPRPRRPIQGG